MTIEAEGKRMTGLSGCTEISPGEKYLFRSSLLPFVTISIETKDRISLCGTDAVGSVMVVYLDREEINKADLKIPEDKNTSARLRWRKD